MKEYVMMWELKTAAGVVSLLVFVLMLRLSVRRPGQRILKACEEFKGLLQEKEQESAWHQNTLGWLHRNGAAFHYGRWVNPIRFLTLRIVLAVIGLLIGGEFAFGYGLVLAVVLYWLPGWLLVYLNSRDNIRLLPEIKLIYHALEIQIRAGVYVTDALAECYGSVTECRLQAALLDLAGDIVMKADIYGALEQFQGKFDNRYIDSLCITILQACESGQAVELLGDIGEQLKDMETVVMNRKKSSLDRSITFYQLAILGAVLLVIIYSCVSHMFQAASSF